MNPLDTTEPSAVDRGVSPVIGVILMVAVTVVLGAVVGTVVLDLGQGVGTTGPSATLRVAADPVTDNVTISHVGGDGLADARTRIVLTNETDGEQIRFEPGQSATVFSAGQTVVVNTTAPAIIGTTGDAFTSRPPVADAFVGGLRSGTQYSVQVVDTRSQRVIFETTVRA